VFGEVPRTHNNEVNNAQSLVLNGNKLPSKKVNIKGIRRKKNKSSFNYKSAQDTLSLPDRAHHFQVYFAALASADDITISNTPLVISPTMWYGTSQCGTRPLNSSTTNGPYMSPLFLRSFVQG
jgi:hypothetical protein